MQTQGAPAHRAVLRASLARDLAFADSGFWDFALLSAYDYGVRKVVLGGVTALSEFGWTERALIGSSKALDFAPSASPFGTLKNLAAVFWHLGLNLGLGLAGAFSIWVAYGGGLAPLSPTHTAEALAACLDLWAELLTTA